MSSQRSSGVIPVLLGWVLGVLTAGGAWAQASVSLRVEPADIGLGGVVRLGGWVPLRVTVVNPTADVLDVELRWSVPDVDGDIAVYRRRVAVEAQRDAATWLYAPIRQMPDVGEAWEIRAVDLEANAALAVAAVRPAPAQVVDASTSLVAVMSDFDLGLADLERQVYLHEPIRLLRGLTLATLPDRWMGLDGLDHLVWTDAGGLPTDPRVGSVELAALREWCYRGGGLSLVLGSSDRSWFQSEVSDLLPVGEAAVRRVQLQAWPDLAPVLPPASSLPPGGLEVRVFGDGLERPASGVLLEEPDGRPLVVSAARGSGTVTLIGVDLASDAVRAAELPGGQQRLWNTVLGLSPPLLSATQADRLTRISDADPPRVNPSARASPAVLAAPVLAYIGVQGSVLAALTTAGVLLMVYLASVPMIYLWLKKRRLARLAWVGHLAAATLATGVAWGGAYLARPSQLGTRHVSVLDLSFPAGDRSPQLAHTRSWVSLLVPRFGRSEVLLPAAQVANLVPPPTPIISPAGSVVTPATGRYIETQVYEVDAAAPNLFDLPVRSTTKPLWLEHLAPGTPPAGQAVRVTGDPLRVDPAVAGPAGTLQHGFETPLEDVLLIYCTGRVDPQTGPITFAWRPPGTGLAAEAVPGRWLPGTDLVLEGTPFTSQPFVRRQEAYARPRVWSEGGWLGTLVGRSLGRGGNVGLTGLSLITELEMLSFFNALPAPDVTGNLYVGFNRYTRPLARRLDLSPMLNTRCLIVLANAKASTLPAPLEVDGRVPPSEGLTFIRAIFELP